jgi:hypothetical protein
MMFVCRTLSAGRRTLILSPITTILMPVLIDKLDLMQYGVVLFFSCFGSDMPALCPEISSEQAIKDKSCDYRALYVNSPGEVEDE